MTESIEYRSYHNNPTTDPYESIKENENICITQEEFPNTEYNQSISSNGASTILKYTNSMNLNTNSSEPLSFKNPVHVAPFFVAEKDGEDCKLTIREEVLRRNNLYGNNLYTFNSYMEERLLRWRPSLSQNNVDDTVNGKHIYFSMEEQTSRNNSDYGLVNLCKRLLETYGIIDTLSQPAQITRNLEKEEQKVKLPEQTVANNSDIKGTDSRSIIHEDFTSFDAQEISLQYENQQSKKETIRKGKQKMQVNVAHDSSKQYLGTNSIGGNIIDAYPVEQKYLECSRKLSNSQPQANQLQEANEPSLCCVFF